MTDHEWPEQLEVAFAPEELHRERKSAARTLRITAWGDRRAEEGLWITGTTTYDWPSISALRFRRIFGRAYLFIRLKPGVRPDAPVVAGLAEVQGPAKRRLPLTPRGPRLLLRTIDLFGPQLALAVRHYSAGRLTIG